MVACLEPGLRKRIVSGGCPIEVASYGCSRLPRPRTCLRSKRSWIRSTNSPILIGDYRRHSKLGYRLEIHLAVSCSKGDLFATPCRHVYALQKYWIGRGIEESVHGVALYKYVCIKTKLDLLLLKISEEDGALSNVFKRGIRHISPPDKIPMRMLLRNVAPLSR